MSKAIEFINKVGRMIDKSVTSSELAALDFALGLLKDLIGWRIDEFDLADGYKTGLYQELTKTINNSDLETLSEIMERFVDLDYAADQRWNQVTAKEKKDE